jgi:hypothetical protein
LKKLNLWRVAHGLTALLKLAIIITGLLALCYFGRVFLEMLMRHFVDIDSTSMPVRVRDMMLDVFTAMQLMTFGGAFCLSFLVKDNRGRMRRTFKSVEQLEQERASIDDIIKTARANRGDHFKK